MEKDNKKKAIPEINEELMMNLMVDGVKKEGLQLPPEEPEAPMKPLQEKPLLKERNRTKKVNEQDYESIFFKRPGTNARDGKTVYIRPNFHEKLSRIVQVDIPLQRSPRFRHKVRHPFRYKGRHDSAGKVATYSGAKYATLLLI